MNDLSAMPEFTSTRKQILVFELAGCPIYRSDTRKRKDRDREDINLLVNLDTK